VGWHRKGEPVSANEDLLAQGLTVSVRSPRHTSHSTTIRPCVSPHMPAAARFGGIARPLPPLAVMLYASVPTRERARPRWRVPARVGALLCCDASVPRTWAPWVTTYHFRVWGFSPCPFGRPSFQPGRRRQYGTCSSSAAWPLPQHRFENSLDLPARCSYTVFAAIGSRMLYRHTTAPQEVT